MGTSVLKVLLRRGHLKAAPWALQFDAYHQRLKYTWRPFGNANPLQQLLMRAITSRLGSNQNQGDLASTARVEQRSYSLTASHQLTPQSSISLTAARQETAGDLSTQTTQLNSLVANWNLLLAARLSTQIGARHARFEGVTPYTENALYASLTQQF